MRAIIFDGTVPRLEQNRPAPQPASGEALIRTLKAGIGGTDLEVCRGLLGFRGTLGHEFVGVVEALDGDGAAGLLRRRVVGSIASACGACDMCVAGLSPHCRQRTVLGLQGRDGCLADHFVLPASNLVAVPDSVDDDHAVFAEPLAAAIQAVRQLTIEGKPYITVLGDGALGLLMVQVMAKLNASVRLVGRHAEQFEVCEKWGIKHRHVDDVGRRADQDIVVDCTGSPTGLEVAMQLVRPRGKIVLKTMVAHRAEAAAGIDLSPIVLNEIEVIGSHRGPIGEAVTLLARREVDVVSLISKRMSLNDGPAVLQVAASPGVIKVLVGM